MLTTQISHLICWISRAEHQKWNPQEEQQSQEEQRALRSAHALSARRPCSQHARAERQRERAGAACGQREAAGRLCELG
jgi:hypothetical protein